MTVCVAAICKSPDNAFPAILGASDRMVTATDIEFEPQRPKILPLTTSIVAMLAGDSTLQWEVLLNVNSEIIARINAEPKKWLNVRDVADWYARSYNEAKLKRAENAILAPLGLSRDSFITRQHELDSDLIRKLATELKNFDAPDVETIFAGFDTWGPHIYVAYNSQVNCLDPIGFAAIGIGCRHANSQLMFSRHTSDRPFPETLLLIYSAKKRAEAAPGVGEGTDMFRIGPQLGSYTVISQDVLDTVETIYKETLTATQEVLQRGEQKINQYIEQLTKAPPTEKQTAISEAIAAIKAGAEVKAKGTVKHPDPPPNK
jgi:hypothetical protein